MQVTKQLVSASIEDILVLFRNHVFNNAWLRCFDTVFGDHGNTQRRCDQMISSDYFVFSRESLAKVLTNQSALFTKARFQNKNKRPRCI